MTRVKNPQAGEAGDAAQGGGAAVAEVQTRTAVAENPTPKRVLPTSLPARELHTDDVREPPLSDVDMPALGEGLPERGDDQIAIADARAVHKEYLDQLAFMEEPVTIRIEPSQQDNAAMTVDCWCNAKGAEVRDQRTGKWLELNVLPVGIVITTKRKYVEILARSKSMRVNTPDHQDGKNVDNNTLTRRHARAHVFSVLKDTDRGTAWLTALLNEAF